MGNQKMTAGNDVSNGGQGSSLKRVHRGEIQEQNQSQGQSREVAEEQPRKKLKIENVEVEPLSPTSTRKTNSPALSLISRVDNTSADGSASAGTSISLFAWFTALFIFVFKSMGLF
jgi:hypothetical protein